MTAPLEPALVRELRDRVHELQRDNAELKRRHADRVHEMERENADLKRQVEELRVAVAALLEPASAG